MRQKNWSLGCGLLACGMLAGCALQEVRTKSKVGTEWRHKGSDSTDDERYSVEQGLEFKWDKGYATGVSVRRRDVNEGTGDNDTGLWLDISFPVWKAPKKADAAEQIRALEERLAQLEAENARTAVAHASEESGSPPSNDHAATLANANARRPDNTGGSR